MTFKTLSLALGLEHTVRGAGGGAVWTSGIIACLTSYPRWLLTGSETLGESLWDQVLLRAKQEGVGSGNTAGALTVSQALAGAGDPKPDGTRLPAVGTSLCPSESQAPTH